MNLYRLLNPAFVAMALSFAVGAARSQETFPTKPIQLIVPLPAGSIADLVARTFASSLSRHAGQPVVIINQTGASGVIASEYLSKANPDGHTILIVNSQHSANPTFRSSLPYDTERDFAGIAMVAEAPGLIAVHPKLGVRTVKDFISHAQRNPGTVNYATAGAGSTTHLAGAYFAAKAGIDLVAIPYKGTVLPDLLAGRVHAMFVGVPLLLQPIREGKLIALAVTSVSPMREPIELPTVEHAADLPGYEYVTYFGFVAPAKVPQSAMQRLSRDIRQSAQEKEIWTRLEPQGIYARELGPAEFDAYIRADIRKTATLVRELGISIDQ